MGFSGAINDYESIYDTMEEAIEDLESRDWKMVGYSSWEEVDSDGLLYVEEI